MAGRRTIKGSSREKRWRTLNGSSLSCQKQKRVKDLTQSILGFWTFLANILAYSSGSETDCKTEGAGSIPDGITTVFSLIRRLPKNHKRFFTRSFYGSSGRVPPRAISKGLYLEPLRVPEGWAEGLFKVILRTFFSESVCNRALALRRRLRVRYQSIKDSSYWIN